MSKFIYVCYMCMCRCLQITEDFIGYSETGVVGGFKPPGFKYLKPKPSPLQDCQELLTAEPFLQLLWSVEKEIS